jgi:hypothetical protein
MRAYIHGMTTSLFGMLAHALPAESATATAIDLFRRLLASILRSVDEARRSGSYVQKKQQREKTARPSNASIGGDYEPHAGLHQGMLLSTSEAGTDTLSSATKARGRDDDDQNARSSALSDRKECPAPPGRLSPPRHLASRSTLGAPIFKSSAICQGGSASFSRRPIWHYRPPSRLSPAPRQIRAA